MAFVVAGAAVLAAVILRSTSPTTGRSCWGGGRRGGQPDIRGPLARPDSSDGEPALPSETSGLTEIISLIPEGDSTESSSREKRQPDALARRLYHAARRLPSQAARSVPVSGAANAATAIILVASDELRRRKPHGLPAQSLAARSEQQPKRYRNTFIPGAGGAACQ
ncbi:MAG: hypothetical protein ACLSB9_29925 [Hydrogeniiclostridium mannosilyticum]